MFLQACVILFTGRGLPQCMLGYPPTQEQATPPGAEPLEQASPRRRPPRAGTPPGSRPPWSRPPRAGTPPGADPPTAEHAGRYGQRTGGTHPTGMQSCFVLNSLESLSQNPASCEFCLCYGCMLKLRYQLLHSLRQHLILRIFLVLLQ